VIGDRTTTTALIPRVGSVDLVVVRRFVAGEDLTLTDAERLAVVHALTESGMGPSVIAERLHENARTIRRTLTDTTAPVDRLGRPFTLT
jgi:hypothetical protein